MHRMFTNFTISLLLLSVAAARHAQGQLILNEVNAVGIDSFVQTDETLGQEKPYEGYDYGVIPHSGNNNSPTAAVNPGNPFAQDLDATAGGGIQTSLPGGWDRITNPTGFGRIKNNGGDWFELVVTTDHTDLRGYTFYWENDDNLNAVVGENPDERGFIKLLDNKAFADLRAGTIITMSESQFAAEIRDEFPINDEFDLGGPDPHDTGYRYDLSTDTSFNPYTSSDWHVHFHVDESLTDIGLNTPYFAGFSDMKADNDLWKMAIYNATNTAIQAQAELPGPISDLTTGLVEGFIGESPVIPGVSVNNQELLSRRQDPDLPAALNISNFEDVDFSTFGRPNYYNRATENTLDGVQDFSRLRNPVLANTYDWNANGTADFGAAGNWINPATSSVPGSGPMTNWTVRVARNSAGAATAVVSTNQTAGFVSVMAANGGSMNLRVNAATTLSVPSGRVLVMSNGSLSVNGTVSSPTVEVFSGGTVNGSGQIVGTLANSGGVVNPGSGTGTLRVSGNYRQTDAGKLMIELAGIGQSDRLVITGTASLAGQVELAPVNGYIPAHGDVYVVLKSTGLIDNGYAVTGTSGFNAYEIANSLLLSFQGANPDFNQDDILNLNDIDALVAAVVNTPGNLQYDVSGDGALTPADVTTWLTAAGALNLPSGNAYLVGDANLDGVVDGQDFIVWNSNKFMPTAAWSAGDFTADGVVDGQDFIAWNTNKFMSADAVAAAVPEPCSMLFMLSGLLLCGLRYRRS